MRLAPVLILAALGCEGERATPATGDPECDIDRDGHESPECGGDDCDDARADVFPGAVDASGREWIDEYVGEATNEPPRVAVGLDRSVHVAAVDVRGYIWRYRLASEWTADLVGGIGATSYGYYGAASSFPGSVSSLLVDPGGVAHVATVDRWLGPLRYANDATEPWDLQILDPAGGGVVVLVEGEGAIEIVYQDFSNSLVRVARQEGDAWSIEAPIAGREILVAANPALPGVVHVLSWDDRSQSTHAVRSAGVWTEQALGQLVNLGACRIAVAGSGALHTVCLQSRVSGSDWLVHTSDEDGFEFETVMEERVRPIALHPSPDGSIHLLATRYDGGEGTSFVHGVLGGGVWEIETVDAVMGRDADLAVDGDGDPHVAYIANPTTSDQELRHATLADLDGVDQDCDGEDG